MEPRQLARYLGWALLVGGGYLAITQLQGGATVPEGTNVSTYLADLEQVQGLSGQRAEGQVMVLNFWATWCGPCRKEAPILSELHDSGIHVVGIATDPLPAATIADKARKLGISYPVGSGGSALVRRFRVEVVPTTYVIDPGGVIVYARAGFASAGALRDAVARAGSRSSL